MVHTQHRLKLLRGWSTPAAIWVHPRGDSGPPPRRSGSTPAAHGSNFSQIVLTLRKFHVKHQMIRTDHSEQRKNACRGGGPGSPRRWTQIAAEVDLGLQNFNSEGKCTITISGSMMVPEIGLYSIVLIYLQQMRPSPLGLVPI